MAAIHYDGRRFDNMDDSEAARLLALAQVAADMNKCVSAVVKRREMAQGADVVLLGPGMAVSAEVDNVATFWPELEARLTYFREARVIKS